MAQCSRSGTGLTGFQVAPQRLLLYFPAVPCGNVNQPKVLLNSEAYRVVTCTNIRGSSGWTNGGEFGEVKLAGM